MQRLAVSLLAALWASIATAEPVQFVGAIGPYDIEAEIERQNGSLVGRYRYIGRDAWLDLTGDAYSQDAMQLNESVGDETTGAFYLYPREGVLLGFWSNTDTDFEVQLSEVSGDLWGLFDPDPVIDITPGLTGQYTAGSYWVNDLFAPNYEIGYNGGAVNVVQIAPGQILVHFDFVVGPTYHIASFRGLAKQTGEGVFVHDATLSGSDSPCRLVFHFDPNEMSIDDIDNGFACQFGARAHANFSLIKTSDIAEFDGSW